MRAEQLVARGDHAHVGVRLGLGGRDEAGLAQRLDDRQELVLEPEPRDLLAAHVLAPLLHHAEAPGLDALCQHAVVPGVRRPHARLLLRVERHPLAEQALVALERQVRQPQGLAGADSGPHLRDVRVDVLAPERLGDGHAVVAVAHEVQVADAVDRDRRERLAAALGRRDPLPATTYARGGRPEAAVEVVRAVDRADDRVELDRLEPELDLADHAERVDDLVEREDQPDVVGLAAQPPSELGEQLRAPRAREVVLRVRAGEAGAAIHQEQATPLRDAR